MSKAVSRVMSWMIIYLDILLPICSSNLPESWRATICFLLGLASSGVYTDPRCYHRSGSLLHYHFILTSKLAVLFLLHFPGSHLHRPLAGILPCGARTFLIPLLARDRLITSHKCIIAQKARFVKGAPVDAECALCYNGRINMGGG